MPPLSISHTGRGKNEKTILENIEEISKALKGSNDAKFLAKYLSLAAHTNSTVKNGTFYLKGFHKQEELQKSIFSFCRTFCVCPKCSDARLRLHCSKESKKSNALAWSCNACGERGLLHSNEKCFGKMKKFICNTLRTGKKAKKKRKNAVNHVNVPKPEVEATEELDFSDWVVDADLSVVASQREKESQPQPEAALPVTPAGMLREKAQRPGVKLAEVVAEYERLVMSRKIEDDLKASRIVRDALWDDSGPGSLIQSFDKNQEFLSWYCSDQTHESMFLSLIEEVIINNGWLKETAEILESTYDLSILSPRRLILWSKAPPENSYALLDAFEVKEVKESAGVFISWIEAHYEE